jgi:hypothetical protein
LIDARLVDQARMVRWPAGAPFARAFTLSDGPLTFNATSAPARFRPVYDAASVVPTAYGAQTEAVALAETALRRAAGVGDRVLHLSELTGLGLVAVRFRHDLLLIQLNGLGLRKLKLSRSDWIDSGRHAYPKTAALAQQLYDAHPDVHGIVWTSRQCDDGYAFMLWGTRLDTDAAETIGGAIALSSTPGVTIVAGVAEACGVLLEL